MLRGQYDQAIASIRYHEYIDRTQTLRGHIGSAISHLMSGVRILEESTLKDDSTEGRGGRDLVSFPYISKEKLIVLFNRLDSQVQQVSQLVAQNLT